MTHEDGMRLTQKREPVTLPLRKKGNQSTLVLTRNPHWEHLALLWMMNLSILTNEVWTEDKPHASSFFNNTVWFIERGSAQTLPEIGVFLFLHRNTETFTVFWIDNSSVLLYDISAEDILHTIFLHLRSHKNTSFLHIANHYFPVVGLLYLTRVQLKNLELLGLQACLVPDRKRTAGRWSVAERRVINPSQMQLQRYIKTSKFVIFSNTN